MKDIGTSLQYKLPSPITRISIASIDPNASVHFTGISGYNNYNYILYWCIYKCNYNL